MARPKKEGLDYFPLDVDIDQDDKVIIIIAKYGMQGFGILIKLLMEVYKNGYYYNWTEKEQLIFSSRVNVDINSVVSIVNDCIKWGLFDEEVFSNYNILTSKGIQERYILATSRRTDVSICEEYKLVNVDINPKSEGVNDGINPQSKVKESKGNKSKGKKFQFADTVFLTNEEYERLVSDYGEKSVKDYIEKLDEWQTNNPKKIKTDHNKTLRVWMKDVKKIEQRYENPDAPVDRNVVSQVNGGLF